LSPGSTGHDAVDPQLGRDPFGRARVSPVSITTSTPAAGSSETAEDALLRLVAAVERDPSIRPVDL